MRIPSTSVVAATLDRDMPTHLSRRAVLTGSVVADSVSLAGSLRELEPGRSTEGDSTGYGSDARALGEDSAESTADESDATDSDIPIASDQLRVEYPLDTLRNGLQSDDVSQDGIPSIDDSQFETVDEVGERLDPDDPVFGVVDDGDV
ncbi:MAG: hypothetical protein ACQETB_06070 [Halobacteriota archaeon]